MFCAQAPYVPDRPEHRIDNGEPSVAGHKILRAIAATSSGLGLGAIRREPGIPPKS